MGLILSVRVIVNTKANRIYHNANHYEKLKPSETIEYIQPYLHSVNQTIAFLNLFYPLKIKSELFE